MQAAIISDALAFLASAPGPGAMKDLLYEWGKPFNWSGFMKDIEEMIKFENESVQVWKPDQ